MQRLVPAIIPRRWIVLDCRAALLARTMLVMTRIAWIRSSPFMEDLFGVLALFLGEPLGLLGHGGNHHGNNDCERKFVEIVEGEAISIVDVLSLTH